MLVEAALDFLDLVQGRRALAAGELLAERRIAADQVAEMAERQRVAGGWIVGMDGAKILPDQKRRSAGDRHARASPGRSGRAKAAPSARADAELLPFGVGPHGAVVGELAHGWPRA